MNAVTFDTLKYANALKAAGFTPEQAEAQVNAQAAILYEVLEANRQDVATKGDMAAMKNELKSDIAALKNEMLVLETRMKADLEKTKVDLIKWNFGAIIAAAGLAMAIARIFFQQ